MWERIGYPSKVSARPWHFVWSRCIDNTQVIPVQTAFGSIDSIELTFSFACLALILVGLPNQHVIFLLERDAKKICLYSYVRCSLIRVYFINSVVCCCSVEITIYSICSKYSNNLDTNHIGKKCWNVWRVSYTWEYLIATQWGDTKIKVEKTVFHETSMLKNKTINRSVNRWSEKMCLFPSETRVNKDFVFLFQFKLLPVFFFFKCLEMMTPKLFDCSHIMWINTRAV